MIHHSIGEPLKSPVYIRIVGALKSKVSAAFIGGPNRRTYALVGGAVVLWASWPALATIAYPAPPFLVLGLSAFVGFIFSYIMAVKRCQAKIFFRSLPKR